MIQITSPSDILVGCQTCCILSKRFVSATTIVRKAHSHSLTARDEVCGSHVQYRTRCTSKCCSTVATMSSGLLSFHVSLEWIGIENDTQKQNIHTQAHLVDNTCGFPTKATDLVCTTRAHSSFRSTSCLPPMLRQFNRVFMFVPPPLHGKPNVAAIHETPFKHMTFFSPTSISQFSPEQASSIGDAPLVHLTP